MLSINEETEKASVLPNSTVLVIDLQNLVERVKGSFGFAESPDASAILREAFTGNSAYRRIFVFGSRNEKTRMWTKLGHTRSLSAMATRIRRLQ